MQAPLNIKQRVGENIAAARASCGLSRRAFGDLIGVDQMLVYKWERGDHRPQDENLAALAQALSLDIAWFYTDHATEAAA